ncbi:MAG: hypothetical protein A2469_01285 [Candidatus Magasanikbacteria bacterium RIFOXYC2_FULL_40_16]|uniref:Ferric oxidoreductase domain-containing protein n=2 Tax=Candidatus Magasanikiibacteriota TaxID=1752731 RepID=A0A1F6NG84_9BACT|nr:MAG: hypothetical protein A2224_01375 [Candidatus Magasanikbacteria bacterium RIFOXYA2_FULL_40_20]OGH82753.1 MAG: hypothetical protein A2373_03875 [Candidatus Magasanikbacteria bacterium RIFOXYB1_FULL_40_15]OGH90394.1 MAG: hypothetical protein A2469_01285 [Candidatus Magasanikbacteria bacterium RIFOXYC2_FULL_40_16]
MLKSIAYYQILGQPLTVILGILTLIFLLFAASVSIMNKKGITKIPFQWHPRLAAVAITLAILHGLLVFLARL